MRKLLNILVLKTLPFVSYKFLAAVISFIIKADADLQTHGSQMWKILHLVHCLPEGLFCALEIVMDSMNNSMGDHKGTLL